MAKAEIPGLSEQELKLRERIQARNLQIEEELEQLGPIEELDFPDLELMRTLSAEANRREEEGVAPYSNIAAQLAMVRNPAFTKQWSGITQGRINSARKHFERQGVIARQALSLEQVQNQMRQRRLTRRRALEAEYTKGMQAIANQEQAMAAAARAESRFARGLEARRAMSKAGREAKVQGSDATRQFPLFEEIRRVSADLSKLQSVKQQTWGQVKIKMIRDAGISIGDRPTDKERKAAERALTSQIRELTGQLGTFKFAQNMYPNRPMITLGELKDAAKRRAAGKGTPQAEADGYFEGK